MRKALSLFIISLLIFFNFIAFVPGTRTQTGPLPSEPTEFAVAAGDGENSLVWAGPFSAADPNQPSITGYRIYRGTSSGEETFLSAVGSYPWSFKDTSVMNGITYYYRISATNVNGEGPLSVERSATPHVFPPVDILVEAKDWTDASMEYSHTDPILVVARTGDFLEYTVNIVHSAEYTLIVYAKDDHPAPVDVGITVDGVSKGVLQFPLGDDIFRERPIDIGKLNTGTYTIRIIFLNDASAFLSYDRNLYVRWIKLASAHIVNATITSYSISSGEFKAGEKVSAEVTVKNTGNLSWTFYVSFSVKDATEVGKWWDAPYTMITLEPEASGTVTLEWEVNMSAPAGDYNCRVAVWKSKSNDVLKDMLDMKEKSRAFEVVPDGYDYDALEWINVIEARNLAPEDEDMSEVTIAIIDTGIDPDIWEYIESKGGDVILYVRPDLYWNWWPPGFRWHYIITNDPNNPNVRDDGGHGSMVASVIYQVVPKAKLMVLHAVWSIHIEKLLQWVINNINEYDVDIISMSFGGDYNTFKGIEDEIQVLYSDFGVLLFASAGNKEAEEYLYPASFDEVISVGGIFDDQDGYLTYAISRHFNYSGHRVVESKYMEYTEYPYEARQNPNERPVGSTYNDRLDFVAPMFDIEVFRFYKTGNQAGIADVYVSWTDGTSFSTPMTAGVASMVFHAYYKKFGVEPQPTIVYEALRETAEVYPTEQDATPKPKIYGKVYDIIQRNDRVGWGCVDAYDAILYVLEEVKP